MKERKVLFLASGVYWQGWVAEFRRGRSEVRLWIARTIRQGRLHELR